ncbi:MAG TPA: hypothetical protein VKU62_10340 [Thermoanaerobaculia bacterium]|nr:hypothetical protein [Thermoanaerobaculia bacterium]
MRTHVHIDDRMQVEHSIPLLDASSLPSDDDWTLLESIHAVADASLDFEADIDRFDCIGLRASYDE